MTLASAGMMAQSVKIAGTLRGSVPADLKLYVMPVGVSSLQPDSVSVNGQKILANTPVSPYNIYKVVAVANRRQNIVPVHLTVKKDIFLPIINGDLSMPRATSTSTRPMPTPRLS